MMFASHGYKGIYSMDTIALGHGPENFESAMCQEYQWARSAIILYFRWRKVVHPTYKHFNLDVWIRTCTTAAWYLSLTATLVWFMVGATIGYYSDWCTDPDEHCNFSIVNFVIRVAPAILVAWGHEMWCRRRRWLRCGKIEDPQPPMIAPTVGIYKVLRTVWMGLGVLAGFQELIFKKSSPFRVTPKGSNAVAALSWRLLQPLILIYVALAAAFWIQFGWKEPAEMGVPIYIYICEIAVVVLMMFIVGMHYWENGYASAENTVGHVAVLGICIAGIVVTSVFQSSFIFSAASANMFIPNFVFPYELIVMSSVYGTVVVSVVLLTFIV